MITTKTSKFLRTIAILLVMASHYAGWMYVEPIHPRAHSWFSSLGPYGVDIFFLMSGYGMVKSASHKSGVSLGFVIKRIISIYVPYLLMVISINALAGNLPEMNARGWYKALTGYDYWYMYILFIFYILFMIIWQMKEHLRLPFITIGMVVTTIVMYRLGRADFWIISNSALLIGIYAAKAEKRMHNGFKSKLIPILLGIVSLVLLLMFTVGPLKGVIRGPEQILCKKLVNNLLFTMVVLGTAYIIPQWKFLPVHIGSCSLFIYILHQYIFWQLTVVFADMSYPLMAVCIGIITLIIGVCIGSVYQYITKGLYKGLRL